MTEKIQIKVSLKIHRFYIPELSEPMEITLFWSRGKSKAQTSKKSVTPDDGEAIFDDKFQMQREFEIDLTTAKPVSQTKSKISVFAGSPKPNLLIGQAELDLASYGDGVYNEFKLMLKGGDEKFKDAYVEGSIKGDGPKTANSRKSLVTPISG